MSGDSNTMNYWLFKSEPGEYSIDALNAEINGVGRWDGIRNYQARNFLRDEVRLGDGVLFYHSRSKQPSIVGTARVVRQAYPDPAQFDYNSRYFDAKASRKAPRWYCVDIEFVSKFIQPVSLQLIKKEPDLKGMTLLHQGRLSIQPVTQQQWNKILTLGE